jgi:hypothetical protein
MQSTVSRFREPKLAFDDAKLVLHLCPDALLAPIPGSFRIAQLPVATALRLSEVRGA